MSIPTEGPRFCLNLGAEFYPAEGDSTVPTVPTVPTVVFGGVRVSGYGDTDGTVCVSTAVDESDLDPAIRTGRGEEGAVAMTITVNDNRVFHA